MARTGAWTATTAAVVLLAACTGPPTAPTPSPGPTHAAAAEESEALLAEWLDPEDPGCSVAVGREGAVVWTGVRGVVDVTTGEPITPETVFDVGSVSKQFTALAVLLLEQDGSLSTDDAVAEHLGGLPGWAEEVTLDQLLHHTSGLPDYAGLLNRRGTGLEDTVTQEDALATVATIDEPVHPPGERFTYSNTGYLLLAAVVEAVSGQDFAAFLADRVLDGAVVTLGRPDGDATVAVGHEWDSRSQTFEPTPSGWLQAGPGFLHATPSALVRWADHYRTASLGGPDLLETMTADPVPTSPSGDGRYAAGLGVLPDGALTHDGQWAGTLSLFAVEADRDTALAISCNAPEVAQPELWQALVGVWTDLPVG